MIEVYRHTAPSGKAYVGFSVKGMRKRWEAHVREAHRGSPLPFHRAIRKYGPETFTHEVLERMITEAGAKRAEQLWIRELGTFGHGYNATAGGDGSTGVSPSAETRVKMAASARSWKRGPEVGAKISAAKLGVKRTPEQCARIGASGRGRIPWNKGIPMAEEQRAKLVQSWTSTREARVDSMRGARKGSK